MLLIFKATKKKRYHNDMKVGFVGDGDIVECEDSYGEELLRDYPENFTPVQQEGKKTVGKAPDKAIKDEKTKKK